MLECAGRSATLPPGCRPRRNFAASEILGLMAMGPAHWACARPFRYEVRWAVSAADPGLGRVTVQPALAIDPCPE